MTSLLKMIYYFFWTAPKQIVLLEGFDRQLGQRKTPYCPCGWHKFPIFPKNPEWVASQDDNSLQSQREKLNIDFSAKTFDDENGKNDHDDGDINDGGDEGDQSIRRYLPLPHQVKREPGHLSFACKQQSATD